MTLALGRLARCRRRVSLALDLDNLLLHHGKPLDLPCDLAGEPRRQAMTISGHKLVDCQAFVLGLTLMPRTPWPNNSPLIRLMCAVRSRTRRLRSRCERRKS